MRYLAISMLFVSTMASANDETVCQTTHWQMGDGSTLYVRPQNVPNLRTMNQRLQFAEHLIQAVFPQCSAEELGLNIIDRSRNYCRRILEGENLSDMCYLSGTFGYYFVHVNLMETAVVSFNRWD
ncbi:MAG: hypothetical protein ABFC56_12420 [Clostridiaceae bacterium]